jgi:hypothetical protein
MTPFEREKMEAMIDLCACVEGLILTETVPEYMVDYLQSRVARFRRLCGLPLKLVKPEDTEA